MDYDNKVYVRFYWSELCYFNINRLIFSLMYMLKHRSDSIQGTDNIAT